MATIKDVAKMAGVSTTTVSHVINKTRFVAKETEEAVEGAGTFKLIGQNKYILMYDVYMKIGRAHV